MAPLWSRKDRITMQYTYTVWQSSGFIQRYPKGATRIDAFLSPYSGKWLSDRGVTKDMSNQRPISPLAVAHFIREGGYNAVYFAK